MKTSSSNVLDGVSLRYWFQTWAAIWGKDERGGKVEESDDEALVALEDGVGVESWV